MKKKESNTEKDSTGATGSLSRRSAIKRIAAIFAASYVGPKAFAQASPEVVAYLSNAPYNPYADSVYGSYNSTGYYSITYYNSYSSHYSSVPPPSR